MIIPTLATLVVGTNGLIDHVDTLNDAQRARTLAGLSEISGELVHHLQDERAAAVRLLGAGDAEPPEELSAGYLEAQDEVDLAEQEFQTEANTLTGVPASFRDLLGDLGDRLALLPRTRNQVAGGSLGVTDAAAGYQDLIVTLINIRESSAPLVGASELDDRMRAAAAISAAKEFLSQQRVVGHEVLIRDAYPPHLRTAFIGTQTGQQQALQSFAGVATAAERSRLDQALEGPDVRQSLLYQDYLDSLESDELGTPPWDAQEWDAVLSAHADLLRDLERDLDAVVVGDSTALRSAVTRQMLVEITALLAMLVLAIVLAWLVARSMARSLRDLRHGALTVAQYGLPQAVARLRDPALSTQLSPAQVASQIAEPLQVRSRDEFGQVAEAFNAVHLEAVRTAAEQASLRSSVSTMFVNLARRSQLLVDRLIGHLDQMERGEEDPDRLAELFQLDHLATRMRRNDENLLVLAGADSTRVQHDPASLIDVLRAAQSEVEHYTRIEFGVVDRDLEIAAHAVNDLVHLVAELLDNATAFSPPDSRVVVEARRVGDRAVLYVEDRGLGLSPEQLADINERLATPPLVDVAVSRMMGLVVVSRLATRHGVRVDLRPAADRGIIADVDLPASVLVRRAFGQPGGALPPRLVRLPPAGERLALESGRSGRDGAEPHLPPSGTAEVLPVAGERPPPPFPPPSFAVPPREQPAPAPASRTLPAWSDLTGASAHNGADPVSAPPVATPLPRRRPDRSRAAADAVEPATRDGAPSVPDQRPDGPPTGTAPPAWPPVTPETPTPVPTETAARVPAAALPAAALQTAPGDPSTRPVDATTELPIFRELESAWFHTRDRPGHADRQYPMAAATGAGPPEPPAAAPGPHGPVVTGTTAGDLVAGNTMRAEPMPEDRAEATAPVHAGHTGRSSGDDWRTVADDGWRAASSAADAVVEETTAAGLPKRRPMAQLVPGGVDRPPTSAQHRTPEAVRGLLSAYHRGVQRGRGEQTTDDDEASGSGGPHSTPAGKEQQT